MCPSYARIRLPIAEAMQRFSDCIGLAELGPPMKVKWNEAIDAATTNGKWRSRVALFIHESGEWTVFNDQTGYLASISAEMWKALAGREELVFAGYNDSVPYGQLIVVRRGQVVREFLDDKHDPRLNVNRGSLDFEEQSPIHNWITVASFVDGDEIVTYPDAGLLWMFGRVN